MESVEQYGKRKGMTVLACTTHDLLSAVTGRPIVVSAADGTEMVLRLMTPDEFQAANRAAVDSLGSHVPYCTYSEAVRVTEPLRIPGF
jgi:hypothetical protein